MGEGEESENWLRGEPAHSIHVLWFIARFNYPDYPARRKTRRTVAGPRARPRGCRG
jgi:hypothetical protein